MRKLLNRQLTTAYDVVQTVRSIMDNMQYGLLDITKQTRRLYSGRYNATAYVDYDQVTYGGMQYSVYRSDDSATSGGEYIKYTIEHSPDQKGYDAIMKVLHAVEVAVAKYLYSRKHNFPTELLRQIRNIIYELDYPMESLLGYQFHRMNPEQYYDMVFDLSKNIARETVRKIKAAVKRWQHRMSEVGRMLHKSVAKCIRKKKRAKRKRRKK